MHLLMSEEGKSQRFPGSVVLVGGLFSEIENTNLKRGRIGYNENGVEEIFYLQRLNQSLDGCLKDEILGGF